MPRTYSGRSTTSAQVHSQGRADFTTPSILSPTSAAHGERRTISRNLRAFSTMETRYEGAYPQARRRQLVRRTRRTRCGNGEAETQMAQTGRQDQAQGTRSIGRPDLRQKERNLRRPRQDDPGRIS